MSRRSTFQLGHTRVTVPYIESTFCIRGEGGLGTAFGVIIAGKQRVVTARHNIGRSVEGNTVFLKKTNGWAEIELREIESSDTHDVSTFDGSALAMQFPPVMASDYSLAMGDQVKFLGFPHGLANTYQGPSGFLTPLTRNAYFSGALDMDCGRMLVLDGFNNPGYSGGPVWYSVPENVGLNLLGVVSGYRVESRSKSVVYEDGLDGTERIVPNLFVKPNSGMIHVVPVREIPGAFDR